MKKDRFFTHKGFRMTKKGLTFFGKNGILNRNMEYAVIYARQSSEEGAKKNLSISAQIQTCKTYIEEKGYILYKIFKDEGVSGSHLSRSGLQGLLRESKKKNFKYVIIYDVSRLSRRSIESAIIEYELQKNNIKIQYLDMDGIDETVKPVIKAVMQAFAELHSRQTSKKTKEGMIQNLIQGYWNGGTPPLGYLISKKDIKGVSRSIIVKDENIIDKIQQYFEMRLNGNTIKTGTEYLKNQGIQKSSGGMRAVEDNALFYAGFGIWNKANHRQKTLEGEKFENGSHFRDKTEWYIVPNHHPAIISEDQANTILGMKKTFKREYHLLSGICYCGKCNHRLWNNSKKRLYCPNGHLAIYRKPIEIEIEKFIKKELFNNDYIEKTALQTYKKYYADHKKTNNSKKIKSLKSKINNLVNAISMVSDPKQLILQYEIHLKELKKSEEKEEIQVISVDEYMKTCKKRITQLQEKTLKNILKILNFRVIISPINSKNKGRKVKFQWSHRVDFISAGDGT